MAHSLTPSEVVGFWVLAVMVALVPSLVGALNEVHWLGCLLLATLGFLLVLLAFGCPGLVGDLEPDHFHE